MDEKDRNEIETMFIALDKKINQLIQKIVQLENDIKKINLEEKKWTKLN